MLKFAYILNIISKPQEPWIFFFFRKKELESISVRLSQSMEGSLLRIVGIFLACVWASVVVLVSVFGPSYDISDSSPSHLLSNPHVSTQSGLLPEDTQLFGKREYIGTECQYPVVTPITIAPSKDLLTAAEKSTFQREQEQFPLCSVWARGKVTIPTEGGRTFVIMGDSMMRQVYQAMIADIRGISNVYDYYYHLDAVYVLDTRTGVDSLTVAISSFEETLRRVYMVANRKQAFVAVFLWNPTLSDKPRIDRFSHKVRLLSLPVPYAHVNDDCL